MASERLAVNLIFADPEVQARAGGLDAATVESYADAMHDGAEFPPVTVYHDGERYWLSDGFHRRAAAIEAGLAEIAVDIRRGGKREAALAAAGANATQGLRRTAADRRKAVERLLADREWSQWSNREIGRRCGVSEGFVRSVRGEPPAHGTQMRTVQRNGRTFQMHTSGIGQRAAAPPRPAPALCDVCNTNGPVAGCDACKEANEPKANPRDGEPLDPNYRYVYVGADFMVELDPHPEHEGFWVCLHEYIDGPRAGLSTYRGRGFRPYARAKSDGTTLLQTYLRMLGVPAGAKWYEMPRLPAGELPEAVQWDREDRQRTYGRDRQQDLDFQREQERLAEWDRTGIIPAEVG